MKFRYLGTAAAEGFPAVFCDCKYCRLARERKGKNIRTRSQAIVNDDLLLDFPADTYMHALNNDLELSKVKYLLVTHSHYDHFYPEELHMRGSCFAPTVKEKLTIVCTQQVYDKYVSSLNDGANVMSQEIRDLIDVKCAKPFETLTLGEYEVTPLPAKHGSCDAFIYMIKQNGVNILYAHDTGYFHESVLDYFKENGTVFDFVSYDCCNIDLLIGDEGSHMGLENISRLTEKLKSFGAITPNTKLYINHFSHNANPLHEELCENAAQYGLEVSYDGLELDL